MNFNLTHLPQRSARPRNNGLTMVMDKGLCIAEAENLIETGQDIDIIDVVKLGFGSAVVTPRLNEKIKLYQQAGFAVYFGGTLFESFVARNMVDDYLRMLDQYNIEHAEVSDGSLEMAHETKLGYIKKLSASRKVFSEVGSKDAEKIIPPYKWIQLMKAELEAGAWKVIAEAREGGNVGIYRGTGEVRSGLVEEILTQVNADDIIWEAPNKAQQIYFIKLLGANVNLGNIATNEVIPLETLRLGLRGDTMVFMLKQQGIDV
jgi:phosphosulfolactate synthase